MNPQQNPVPRLDLAPKLKRPLSLLNPLDYLRLLYWVFYFPQAIRWYVETFGNQKEKNNDSASEYRMPWQKVGIWLREHPIESKLYIQGLILTLLTPVLISAFLQQIGVSIDWSSVAVGVAFGVAFGVAVGVAFGVAVGVAFGVGLGVAFGVAFGVGFGVVFGMAVGVAEGVAVGVALGVAVGVGYGAAVGAGYGAAFGAAVGVAFGAAVGVAFGVAVGLGYDVAFGVVALAFGVGYGVAFGMAFGGAFGLLENWLFSLWLSLFKPWNKGWRFVHVTGIPVWGLTSQVKTWLRQDWPTGVHNVNQLLTYTLQFIPVVTAVNWVLQESPPDQIIWRVAQLAKNPYNWGLVRCISENKNTRLDTHPGAVVAEGFWYLYKKEPQKATQAFAVVRQLLYGEEMYRLAETLAKLSAAKDIKSIIQIHAEGLNLTSLPPVEQRLRAVTWQGITRLYRVASEVFAVQASASRNARSSALNLAQGELQTILEEKDNLPQPERELILKIAQRWQEALLQIAGEVGNVTITEPVRSPYVIGNPVEGSLFVGREDILRQLEELWIEANRLQSVVLFGHRRMGKTSILRNINACLEDGVKLAYVNMLNVGNAPQGVGEVLMAICDEIAEIMNIYPPADEDLLKLPYPTFRRFLQQVDKVLAESPQTPLQKGGLREESPQTPLQKGGLREESPQTPLQKGGLREESPQNSLQKGGLREGKGLIIALDEFEKIEDLINAGKIEPGFMGMLRTQVQASPRIAFAFAGLHTLEEMTEDYFQPFFASIIPIAVSFLSRGSTAQLLANPDEDFILDYQPDALDFIYDLTCGQPFLVQLVGFQLVRHYNQEMFETGKKRDPVFTVDDVEAVINDPEFYQRGRYYFTGVWGQAAQDVPGQQDILQVLAPYKSGLPVEMVREITGLDEEVLLEAIKGLKRHDVVEEKAGNLRILVELFRLWVEKKPGFSGGK
ncbi:MULTISPECIES: ATP-binding protein [Planktothricoides]|uniref:ATP-binding protein n=1 Tax=Planktothricoides raciborskii FACHB-1370 TaxID=2949576 RepID=A0ABR8ED48_9CYAN|nr:MULTISPECIES: ATP-binding protein [Planktothricoides]MBD2544327.1 ATP-binding protein [Planktothricoides raciborskii FACHB-1370]MBD2582174.1 ATP-binding protein [Planktothricoides raciborskii FACHB-1261]